MLTPLVMGARGNMGRRYQAILHYLGRPYWTIDMGDAAPQPSTAGAPPYDAVLIATPTAFHVDHILIHLDKPVLCEKPITTDMTRLWHLVSEVDRTPGACVEMVDQYRYLATYGEGPTEYDYFRSGGDGIWWDTINIGAKARGTFSAKNDSPVWRCVINGTPLWFADMDRAYIDMVHGWLKAPRHGLDYIVGAHELAASRAGGKR